MKIGYFNTFFPYKNPLTNLPTRNIQVGGGVENVVYNLAVKMAEKGHDVYIFSTSVDKNETREVFGKIVIYRYKKNFKIGSSPTSIGVLYKPLRLDVALDIVHAHFGNLPAPLGGYWYAKKWKTPFVVTHHGDYIGGFGDPVRKLGVMFSNLYLTKKVLSSSDVIIALSQAHINDSKVLPQYLDKIKVIPNGINLKDFDIPMNKSDCRKKLRLPLHATIILFVGSLTPRKGPHILIKAMQKVVGIMPNALAVIVGGGSMKPELERMVKEYRLEDHVRFTGFIDEKLKPFYYKASDAFALPSFSEAFPLTLLEASAAALPLIGSSIECLKGIIEAGFNGVLSETGNHQDLAEKIVELFRNEKKRDIMAGNSKVKARSFSWDKIVQETETLYLNLLEG